MIMSRLGMNCSELNYILYTNHETIIIVYVDVFKPLTFSNVHYIQSTKAVLAFFLKYRSMHISI